MKGVEGGRGVVLGRNACLAGLLSAGVEGRRAPEGMFALRWRDAGSFIKAL